MKTPLLVAILAVCGCSKQVSMPQPSHSTNGYPLHADATGCCEDAQQIHVLLLDRLAAQADEIKRQSNVIQIYMRAIERSVIPCDDEPPFNGIHSSNFEARIGFVIRKPCQLTNAANQEIWVTWTNGGFQTIWFGATNFYPINK